MSLYILKMFHCFICDFLWILSLGQADWGTKLLWLLYNPMSYGFQWNLDTIFQALIHGVIMIKFCIKVFIWLVSTQTFKWSGFFSLLTAFVTKWLSFILFWLATKVLWIKFGFSLTTHSQTAFHFPIRRLFPFNPVTFFCEV